MKNKNKSSRLHEQELPITIETVSRLLWEQYSQVHREPISLLTNQGTDNLSFSLGEDKIVRLPRTHETELSLLKEIEVLPLFKNASLPTPEILFQGSPSPDYPCTWIIQRRLFGETSFFHPHLNQRGIAIQLAELLHSLWRIPVKTPRSSSRTGPLRLKDQAVRNAIKTIECSYPKSTLIQTWEKLTSEKDYDGPPLWTHGDLHFGNILISNGLLSGLIDFGLCGTGDPAVDLMCAWTILNASERKVLFNELGANESLIQRARGWAFFLGIVAAPYYKNSKPDFAEYALRTLGSSLDAS